MMRKVASSSPDSASRKNKRWTIRTAPKTAIHASVVRQAKDCGSGSEAGMGARARSIALAAQETVTKTPA